MKTCITLTVAACLFQATFAIVCPPNYCDTKDCSQELAAVASCDGRIAPNGGFCGCCPACIKQLAEGEFCGMPTRGVPKTSECGQGLECHATARTCVKSGGAATLGPCHAEVLAKSQQMQPGMVGVHIPECLEDGYYAPVQCIEAVCMCVDKKGKQIEGYATNIGSHSQMNCQCARDKDAMKISTLHFNKQCDEFGNYERVQCNAGNCYCVNMFGQKIDGFGTRPEERKEELGGCLELRARRQDSVGVCQHEVDMIVQNGQPMVGARIPQCLDDGTYNPIQCFGSVCGCVDSEGKPTGHSAHISQFSKMTCNCARDKADYMKTGMVGKFFNCDRIGSYEKVQCLGSVCHCVDEKGVKLTEKGSVSISNLNDLEC